MKKHRRVAVDEYTLMQIFPANNYLAAMWDDEKKDMFSEPIDFLGLADVVEVITELQEGMKSKVISKNPQPPEIVAVSLTSEGYFEVMDSYANFCGIFKEGGNIYKATGRFKYWEYPGADAVIASKLEKGI